MKKILLVLLAFILSLSGCEKTFLDNKQDICCKNEQISTNNSIVETEDFEDPVSKEITEKRKKVYSELENTLDILTSIPNPSQNGPVEITEFKDLPQSVNTWATKYFNYHVTFEIPEWYDPNSEMGRILRFLVAMKRTSSEPADVIEITTDSIVAYRNDNDTIMHLDVTFYCYPKKYDENTKEYIIIKNSSEKIRMLFMFNKINGEWVMEDDKLICGNLTDYAKKCMNRTWGRFPELDENEVVDFAICEYTEKLYDFGIIPGP